MNNLETSLESFLVEDVILTLGNLRGALAWLGRDRPEDRAGIERIDRQIGMLADRAHEVRHWLRAEYTSEQENLFVEIETSYRPAPQPLPSGWQEAEAPAPVPLPVFHSRRAKAA